jgi:RNA polymerase sigma factor FliA
MSTIRQPGAGATDGATTLAEQHLGLVDEVVTRVATGFPGHVERDELRGAGAAGLVEAVHRFDAARGVPFARYAEHRIRGAVLDSTRARDWASRRLRRDLRAIETVTARLEERLGHRPDDEEVARELGMEPRLLHQRRAAAAASTLLALDRSAVNGTDDGGPLSERVREQDATWLPEAALERAELLEALRTAFQHLPDPLKRVLREHHFEGRRLRDIAGDLGVTEARASQLRHEAFHALQAYFGTAFEGVPMVPDDAPGKRRRTAYVEQVATASTCRGRSQRHRSSRHAAPRASTVGTSRPR